MSTDKALKAAEAVDLHLLTVSKLREIFDKYDTNKDKKLDETELNILVTDIFKHYNKKTDKSELSTEDQEIISFTVSDLLKLRDLNKNGALDWDEFASYYRGKNVIENSHGNIIN